tara:strand:- start:782 stop:2029 length:1248 start_codon:yes stop_codon:yes gene_type:complete
MSNEPLEPKLIPKQPEINIGTTGHVDHGKTTFVEAITGVWTSAHSEELRRGITIRVGYADAAFYKCPSCDSPECYSTDSICIKCGSETELLRVASFVDCPGHESLMANMISGAALMDGSVLVIATNEKIPQPQTREHLLALQMLGTKNIVIGQNKVDLVDDKGALEGYRSIKQLVKNTVAEKATIVPISAQNKINIDASIEAIEKNLPTPKRDLSAPSLMQLLRSFDINRPGIRISGLKGGVVGGTLIQGEIKIGDEIEIRPGLIEKDGKTKSIQTQVSTIGTAAGLVEKATPGGLIAIGTTLDPALTKSDSLLGSILGNPEHLPPVFEVLSMTTQLFDMAVGAPDLIKVDKIKKGEALRLNVGTAVTLGTVSSVKDDVIEVKLRRKVSADKGNRIAISRRIFERWRLIGAGTLT